MARRGLVVLVVLAAAVAVASAQDTAVDVAREVYAECLQRGSFACIRPRLLAFLAEAEERDDRAIRITRDLAIVPSGNGLDATPAQDEDEDAVSGTVPGTVMERVNAMERFLRTHEVRVAVPEELSEAVPAVVRESMPSDLRLPLDPDSEDGATARHRKKRGFLKKVVLPFILGLKFKTTALVPLALSLIALKTWKAFTLGLLSLVLSGAMVIFRFTKPKVVNYDVYHYPQTHGHYDHHVDHHVDHGHYDHYDHHSYAARSADGMAYSAHHP